MHYSFRFLLAALAVWRLTHLLANENGPWDMFQKLRDKLGQSMAGNVLSCFYCLSVWMAIPFAFFAGGAAVEIGVSWAALSGAAILLERVSREPFDFNVEGNERGMLRGDGRRQADH